MIEEYVMSQQNGLLRSGVGGVPVGEQAIEGWGNPTGSAKLMPLSEMSEAEKILLGHI